MSIDKTILEHIIVGATPSSIEISEDSKGIVHPTIKVYSETGKEIEVLELALALFWRAKEDLLAQARRRMEEAMAASHMSTQEDDGRPE